MNPRQAPDRADRLTSRRSAGLAGDLCVSGDKSISHRALILAAMAPGESRISGLSEGLDVRRTIDAVRALGAQVEQAGGGTWSVRGGTWRSPEAPLDCGNSGTTARLLVGAVAGRPIRAGFTGDSSLCRRPMSRITTPLREMGARIEGGATLPISIEGGALGPISLVNRFGSAQLKSAILLAGLGAAGPVEVVEPVPSRDHTERMLPLFGVPVGREETDQGLRISLGEPRQLRGSRVDVPGDPSAAAFPLVAALITPGSELIVRNVLVNPLRTGLFTTLREMGADLRFSGERSLGAEPVADIRTSYSRLHAVTVPADRAPTMIDEYPILAVAAAFARGETVMHGLGELRHKESDRLAAIVAGLAACGVAARIDGDSLTVSGGTIMGGAEVASHGDHRVAMSFLVLGLASSRPVGVDQAEMIATSFPRFAETMRSIGARIGPSA
jgi:3-phosphoshikimate 1-carboxyvinyltransferase